ncbi:ImuA family protein [Maritalea mobilis]|uniref:ImuA family protein n=1 Tax=Maritalea mobilis TaxID=483324 RepID=UPI001AACF8B0|nr:hypothetical protein [Maritalea mobilis]
MMAGQLDGPILWARSRWQSEQLHPLGLTPFYDPARAIMVKCKDQTEILGTAEDALRSGAVSFIVAELPEPLDFRQGRRLQLAAKDGNIPGLFMVQNDAGNNAAHTRWHCEPIYDSSDSTLQRWSLIKNKTGTLKSWEVRWHAKSRRVIVVSEASEQPRFTPKTS